MAVQCDKLKTWHIQICDELMSRNTPAPLWVYTTNPDVDMQTLIDYIHSKDDTLVITGGWKDHISDKRTNESIVVVYVPRGSPGGLAYLTIGGLSAGYTRFEEEFVGPQTTPPRGLLVLTPFAPNTRMMPMSHAVICEVTSDVLPVRVVHGKMV